MRPILKQLALALVIASVPLPAIALLSGNSALELCTSTHPSDVARCQGFVMGAVGMAEGVRFSQDSGAFVGPKLVEACLPDSVTVKQLTDVFVAYLQENPEVRHYSAASSAWTAMHRAFPCE